MHQIFTHLLLTCLVSFFVQPLHAQRLGFTTPPWARHTHFWVSSDGPILAHMLRQPGLNTSANTIISYMSHVEDNIISALRNATTEDENQRFNPCTVRNKGFGNSIRTIFALRGLPDPIYDCITDVTGTRLYANREPLFSTDQIFQAVATVKQLADQERMYIRDKILFKWPPHARILSDWSSPTSAPTFPWVRANKRCQIAGVGFMRVNHLWYFNIGVTSAAGTTALPHWERQTLFETVHIGLRGLNAHALLQRVPTYDTDEHDGPSAGNTTTIFQRGQGLSLPSTFYPTFPEENPALTAAFTAADLPIRQVNDALSPSSLSILFMPLVLNIVPIALITHVGTRALLVYMLFSDFVTVVPLAIKGAELFVIGTQRFRAVTARVENNMSGMRGVAAAGQLWTAECRAEIDTRSYGVAFVSVSLVAVVVGVWLEVWARRFVARRGRRKRDKLALHLRIGADETYETYDLDKGALGTPSATQLSKRGSTGS